MAGIRPLRADDLPRVADLFEARRPGVDRAPSGMAEHFHARFLEGPTYDPEVPSLVAEAGDGAVVGFIGASVVPMLLDGRTVRAVATGPLVTARDARVIAAFLIRALIGGPQAFTFSDRQTLASHRLLVRLGARPMHPRCVTWVLPFRPFSYQLQRVRRTRPLASTLLRLPAPLLDRGTAPFRRVTHDMRPLRTEPLASETVAASIPGLLAGARLRPRYDAGFWAWRMLELQAAKRLGNLRAHAIYAGETLLGWYVYLASRGDVSHVLQLLARPGEEATVLGELVRDAARCGTVALKGRLEPELDLALRDVRCTLEHGPCLLVHARDGAVYEAFASDKAVLTPLDGEAWISATFPGAVA